MTFGSVHVAVSIVRHMVLPCAEMSFANLIEVLLGMVQLILGPVSDIGDDGVFEPGKGRTQNEFG